MKNKIIKTSVFALIVLLAIFLISCNSDKQTIAKNSDVQQSAETQQTGAAKTGDRGKSMKKDTKNSGERKVKYWQAPMNPTEIYDKPGKSMMGMDLIPVYDDEVSSGPSVKINPATVQNMGVRFARAERKDFSRVLRTVGTITYNEEKIYTVSPKISGWIEKLYVNSTGQPVSKGQTLLEIYSPNLVTTQQEYLLALRNREQLGKSANAQIREGAESLVAASRQRLQYWDIPEKEINNLEKSGKVRKTLTLQSPQNGIILHLNAEEGKFVKAGTNLYKIADLSTVWVDVSIYDNETPWIHEGQEAEMTLSYLPGEKFIGKVRYIYPYLDKKARDIKVRLEFKNPGLKLKPGMYANILLKSDPVENAIVVPTEAVLRSGTRNLVFISQKKGRFEPREVTLGAESEDGTIRILSGLTGNEKIVVSAQFLIDSESRLQEAIQKMLAGGSSTNSTGPKGEGDENAPTPDHSKMKNHENDAKGAMKCGDGMDMKTKTQTEQKKQ